MKYLLAAAAALTLSGAAAAQENVPPLPPDPPPIVTPAADMPLPTFRERARPLRRGINKARRADCRRRHDFRPFRAVLPHRRAENLRFLRSWRAHARARKPACTPRQLGERMAARYGWTHNNGEWGDLEELWQHESGWNPTAVNPRSGACGIPQAISCPYPLGRTPAIVRRQIGWGLNYIDDRYRSPSRALDHFNDRNWY